MKKRLLLIITVGVCFSPSLYAMGPDYSAVGAYNTSNAFEGGPAASACKAGLAVVTHSQEVIAQNSKYLPQNSGNTTSNSATSSDNNN